jgi:acetyl-CoA acetyltransferase
MAGKFEDDVIISGIGQSSIGRRLGRSPLALTLDAITAAVADAGLSVNEIGGLTTYPGGGTSVGPGFGGPSLADVYDALGLEIDFMMGNFEGPAQLGPVVSASLAISAGLVRHVVVFRTVTEGSGRHQARAGAGGRVETSLTGGTSPWITAFGGGAGSAGLRAPRSSALLRVRHVAAAAGADRTDGPQARRAESAGRLP